jgi:hypothetical protein
LENKALGARLSEVGAVVREQVVRLLKRKDLRIGMEVALNDLRNAFTGYETLDPKNQHDVLADATRVIEELETLIAADRVLNPDRQELPEPPPLVAKLVRGQVDKILKEAREKKERLQKETQMHRLTRRHPRPPAKPVVFDEPPAAKAGREQLAFTGSPANEGDRRGDRRHRFPRRNPEPPAAPKPAGPPPPRPEGGGPTDKPPHHRHRRHRRKK